MILTTLQAKVSCSACVISILIFSVHGVNFAEMLQKAWARQEAQKRRELGRPSRAQSVPAMPSGALQSPYVPRSTPAHLSGTATAGQFLPVSVHPDLCHVCFSKVTMAVVIPTSLCLSAIAQLCTLICLCCLAARCQ